MANEKFSDLPAKGALVGTEVLGIADAGASKSTTVNTIASFTELLAPDVSGKNLLNLIASTGITEGGLITPNADPTKFDIAAGKGIIVDNWTDVDNPTIQEVTWGAQIGVTATLIGSTLVTGLYIDNTGTLIQSPFVNTEEIKDKILVGGLTHATGFGVIESIFNNSYSYISPSQLLNDLFIAIGAVNIGYGNTFFPNGANLNINKTAGAMIYPGAAIKIDPKDPNFELTPALTAPNFALTWQDGVGGFNNTISNAINPGRYDDGTGGVTQPNGIVGNNNFQNFRIYMGVNNALGVQYGQRIYATIDDAVRNVRTDVFNENPLYSLLTLRCYLSVKGNATNLSDPAQAVFQIGPSVGR